MSDSVKLISSCAELSVRKFEQIIFSNKYEVLIISGEPTKEDLLIAWNNIYIEYLDLSGLAESSEMELSKSVFYLESRTKRMELYLSIQKESLDKIGIPCIGAFERIRQLGHRLQWKNDVADFNKQLSAVEAKEKRYVIELAAKTKELAELKAKRSAGEISVVQSRKDFVRMKNNLGKHGYKIDIDKTTVEELALMVCDYYEEGKQKQ